MADVEAPLIVVRPPSRYRALGIFWTIVAAVTIGVVVTLQIMGAPRPATPPREAAVVPPAPKVPLAPRADLIAAPDAALQEPAPDFQGRTLPIRAPEGRTPMVAYKAPFDMGDKHPKVVLVVDGAGLDQDQTMRLLDQLPGPVDVVFSAYTEDRVGNAGGAQLSSEARKTGHECLQSIPMEPNNYPMAEEGSVALKEGASPEANRQSLEYSLSRMPGCIGATGASDGLAGEHFAQDGLGFGQVLEEVGKRGLLYLDPRTGAPMLDADKDLLPIAVVDLVVDQSSNPEQQMTPEMMDQRLALLEEEALKNGVAIGLAGPPQPVMLDRIAIWAHGLAARGLTLAPLTAVVTVPKQNADENAN